MVRVVWLRMGSRLLRIVLSGSIIALVLMLAPPTLAQGATGRFFPQTGYSIEDPQFLDYYDHRGGLRAFGYPVSRKFTFLGFPVQVFQRSVMQKFPDGHVALLNLLDNGLFPYTEVNGARFPGVDPALVATAPAVGSPGYNQSILTWIGSNTPDRWNGLPVVFYHSFLSTISPSDVFSTSATQSSLLSGFDLEIWGVPTSHPALDPHNTQFVYQRFQRGILHYDGKSNATQGILLADYFKSVLMAENLPPDLASQARPSGYFGQYNPLKPGWVDQPGKLPNTDLTRAFEPAPVIVLDPGHGGAEVGTSYTFPDGYILREKDLTLAVATKVAAILRPGGYTVLQTRTTDSWVDSGRKDVTGDGHVDLSDDLQMRVDLANSAHATLFLSIHFNGYEDTPMSGTTSYYDDARPFSHRSEYFAELMDREMVNALQGIGYHAVNRGVQTDGQAVGKGSHFYVLGPDATRPIQMPGVLEEGLFLTNPADAALLRNPHTLDVLAQAYAKAIVDYYPSPR